VVSGRVRSRVDDLKLDRGQLAEYSVTTTAVVGPFDPGDDRKL
jgi:hypothetical protein